MRQPISVPLFHLLYYSLPLFNDFNAGGQKFKHKLLLLIYCSLLFAVIETEYYFRDEEKLNTESYRQRSMPHVQRLFLQKSHA